MQKYAFFSIFCRSSADDFFKNPTKIAVVRKAYHFINSGNQDRAVFQKINCMENPLLVQIFPKTVPAVFPETGGKIGIIEPKMIGDLIQGQWLCVILSDILPDFLHGTVCRFLLWKTLQEIFDGG